MFIHNAYGLVLAQMIGEGGTKMSALAVASDTINKLFLRYIVNIRTTKMYSLAETLIRIPPTHTRDGSFRKFMEHPSHVI